MTLTKYEIKNCLVEGTMDDYLAKIGLNSSQMNTVNDFLDRAMVLYAKQEVKNLAQSDVSGRVCFSPDCFFNDKTMNTCVGDYVKCTVKQTHR